MVVFFDEEDEDTNASPHELVTAAARPEEPRQWIVTKIITKSKLEKKKDWEEFCAKVDREDASKRKRRLEIYQAVSKLADAPRRKRTDAEYKKLLKEIDLDSLAELVYAHRDVKTLTFMLVKRLMNPSLCFEVTKWMVLLLEYHMEAMNENVLCVYCLCGIADFFVVDLTSVLKSIIYMHDLFLKALVAGLLEHVEKKKKMITSEDIEEFWKDYAVRTRELPKYPDSVIMAVPNFPAFITIDHTQNGPVTEVVVSERLPTAQPPPPAAETVETEQLMTNAPPPTTNAETEPLMTNAPLPTNAGETETLMTNAEPVERIIKRRRKKLKPSFDTCDTVLGVETMFVEWKCRDNLFGRSYELSKTRELRLTDILDMYKQFAIAKKRADDYYVSATVSNDKKMGSLEQAVHVLESKYIRVEEKKFIRRNIVSNVYFTI